MSNGFCTFKKVLRPLRCPGDFFDSDPAHNVYFISQNHPKKAGNAVKYAANILEEEHRGVGVGGSWVVRPGGRKRGEASPLS